MSKDDKYDSIDDSHLKKGKRHAHDEQHDEQHGEQSEQDIMEALRDKGLTINVNQSQQQTQQQQQRGGCGRGCFWILLIPFAPILLALVAIASPFYLAYALYHKYASGGDVDKVDNRLFIGSIVGTVMLLLSIGSAYGSEPDTDRSLNIRDHEVKLTIKSERQVYDDLVELGETEFSNYMVYFPDANIENPDTLNTSQSTQTWRIDEFDEYQSLIIANGRGFGVSTDSYVFRLVQGGELNLIDVNMRDGYQYQPVITNQSLIPADADPVTFQEDLLIDSAYLSRK